MKVETEGLDNDHWCCKCNDFFYYLPKGYIPKGHPVALDIKTIVEWENRMRDEDKSHSAIHG